MQTGIEPAIARQILFKFAKSTSAPLYTKTRFRLKNLREFVGENAVNILIGNDHGFMRGIHGHAANVPQHAMGSANGPARRNSAVIVNAPHADIAEIGRPASSLANGCHNEAARRD